MPISIQNEPQYTNPTHPTSMLTHDDGAVSICQDLGSDHSWDGTTNYAMKFMQAAPETSDGVAFHYHGGSVWSAR